MTIGEKLTTDAILDAFATAGDVLPREALLQAANRWPEVGPVLLALLEAAAAGSAPSKRTDAILVFGIYLMAQMRDTRAWRPLCILGADGTRLEEILTESVLDDLSAILVRVYDGDPAPLRRLIEAEVADQYVRDAAFDALAWLTATGQLDRDETARTLRELFTTLRPEHAIWVWSGWQEAITHLGLEELVPLVEEALARGLLDPEALKITNFPADLRAAREAADPTSVFDPRVRELARLDDLVEHMSGWLSLEPKQPTRPQPLPEPRPRTSGRPVPDRFRNVGRNDPCPCGSGKKFKKCCLGKTG